MQIAFFLLAIATRYLNKLITQLSSQIKRLLMILPDVVTIFPGYSLLRTSEVKSIVPDINDKNSNMKCMSYLTNIHIT